MNFSDTPRQSVVAGRFYPGDAGELREQVATYLALRPSKPADLKDADVLAVMVPHAGYVFSGPVAGMTLGLIDLPDRIILLGPNHTGRGAPISVWSGGGWETPLGTMPIDAASRDALIASGAGFSPDMAAHGQEHSLEVVVPFLQVKNPAARFVPITVDGVPMPALEAAGRVLAATIEAAASAGERVLLVVSSDMSHYLPHDKAMAADSMVLGALASLDPEKFHSTVRGQNITMCGVFPMTMALFALNRLGATKARVIAYATSGQTGRAFGADMSKVVGYAGVALTR